MTLGKYILHEDILRVLSVILWC